MKILYIDGSAGVSGRALLGALLHLGLQADLLKQQLQFTFHEDFELHFRDIPMNGLTATEALLETSTDNRLITAMQFIHECRRNPTAELNSTELKKALLGYAAARAKILKIPVEELCLEKNLLLRIAVNCSAFLTSLTLLGVHKVVSTPIPVGGGRFCAEHPDDEPLFAELARGAKIKGSHLSNTTSTATGILMLSSFVDEYGELPEMLLLEAGYGALKDEKNAPLLRVLLGNITPVHQAAFGERESIKVIETNIDDMNPEFFPYLIERLLKIGAMDAYLTPVYMKKGRPANQLTVLCRENTIEEVLKNIFKETTTLGVRIREEKRRVLFRKFFKTRTPYGTISIKAGYFNKDEKPVQVAPEFEECKKIAIEQGVPLKEVYAAAQRSASEQY